MAPEFRISREAGDSKYKVSRGETLCMETMVAMLAGVANGMRYLTDKGFVHRVR